ncbi:MAG: hypothetical protein QY329_12710 [Anaerolineales bacterium]|nr:MAG: hypothetical protein QY329_12710 [Anaerolineales bacterium]
MIKKIFFIGFKLGVYALFVTACVSPSWVYIHLYILAVERKASSNGIFYELYCFGGPIMVLLWFSLPYLFGTIVLVFLIRFKKDVLNWLLSSAIIGIFVGLLGNLLMAKYFLASSMQEHVLSDWMLLGIMEVWSIVVFIWIGSRAFHLLKTDA